MRIDTHVHIFPESAGIDPPTFASSQGELHWLKLVAPKDRSSIQAWADPETCLRHMDSVGIDMVILQGWYWENADTCTLHNAIYAEILKKWPDRFKAFASFHPDLVRENPACLDQILESGFSGLGELLPQAQGYMFEDPDFVKALRYAE
ncbi:MAG: amidohydrolase, partial [Verrucomicrobiota bacterium]